MKRVAGLFGAVALAVTMAVTGVAPVHSAPLPVVPVAPKALPNDVVNVQLNRAQQEFGGMRRWRGDRRYWGGRPPRWDGPRHGYHNGYRGYRKHRHGYRYHNGFWFPAGAFIAGAILGGALAAPPPSRRHYRSGGGSHVAWCYNRYRSYRDWDNTFQPYNGPRQQCYSPYS